MKKFYILLVSLFLISSIYAAPVIVNGTLIEWTDASGDIVIPNSVKTIADNVFSGNENITSVAGDSVQSIGQSSFLSCYNLKSVSLTSVTNLGVSAFGFCPNLNSFSFPNLTSLGESAFMYCENLTSVSLPLLQTISSSTFEECYKLATISFPEALNINDHAFCGCESLTSILFQKVQYIGDYAFCLCNSLTSISLPLVKTIKRGCFTSCKSLRTLNLPVVTTLEESAFNNCSELVTVSLPLTESIGSVAFNDCQKLVSISVPKLKNIDCTAGYGTFKNCFLLDTISLPSIEKIGPEAFSTCFSLKTVDCSVAMNLNNVDATAFQVTNSGLTIKVSGADKVSLFPPVTERQYQVIYSSTEKYIGLNANPAEGGTVSGAGSYALGSTAIIKAVTNSGYKFINWTEGSLEVSTSSEYTFTVSDNRQLTANFQKIEYYTFHIIQAENGIIQVFNENKEVFSGDNIEKGTKLKIKAVPADGYLLDYVEIDDKMNISASYKQNSTASPVIKAESRISVYPNPSSTLVIVTIADELRAKELVVVDASGKIVNIQPIHDGKVDLNVTNYADGVYLLKASDAVVRLVVKK